MRVNFLIILILFSCSNRQSDNIANSRQAISDTPSYPVPSSLNTTEKIDSLIFDSVKINGKIPLKLKVVDLLDKLGQPDSIIVEHGWDCGNYLNDSDSVDVYYYGLSRFIISKGEALLHRFYPDKKLTFETNDFKIAGETSESEIQLIFPNSYANMLYRIQNDKHFGKRRLKVGMIKNPISPDDNGFIFYFENGRLIRIDLWWFIC